MSVIAGAGVQSGLFGKVLEALLGGSQTLPMGLLQPPPETVGQSVPREDAAEGDASASSNGSALPDALLALAGPAGEVESDVPAGPQDASGLLPVDPTVQACVAGPVIMPGQTLPVGQAPVLQTKGADGLAEAGPGRGQSADLAGERQILPEDARVQKQDPVPGQLLVEGPEAMAGPVSTGPSLRPVAAQAPVEGQAALLAPERVQEQLTRTAVPARESLALQLPLRSQGWDSEFSQRVVWMAGRQSQWAEISLNPPNLGSVEVRLSMNGNEAGAQFFSPQSSVREAIEASMPRLREMLAAAGINLGEAQVSAESFTDRRDREASGGGGAIAVSPDTLDQPVRQAMHGLIDLYV